MNNELNLKCGYGPKWKIKKEKLKLDLTFSGSTYEFMFGLDDRTKMGTDVLLNRFVMNKLNVMVNPQRKFIVTTKKDI